jgi:hypothetical protein
MEKRINFMLLKIKKKIVSVNDSDQENNNKRTISQINDLIPYHVKI